MQQEQKQLSWARHAFAVGVAALACISAPAPAASFDCAKAAAKVEKAICADKELSILDDRMAEAYKKRLTAWQGEIAEYVRNDQREFIKMLRSAHEGEVEDQIECAKAYVACVKTLMRERVATLESQAYPMTGVFQRKGAKLLLSVKDDTFDVLLFDKASNTIRSTLKYERPGQAPAIRKDASGYVASDMLASKLGEGVVGDAMNDSCEVRLRMSGKVAEVTQGGKCGADFSGKYQRVMKDRVENYANSID
jgi:uncharacterized protein